jgi:hypothetical protein
MGTVYMVGAVDHHIRKEHPHMSAQSGVYHRLSTQDISDPKPKPASKHNFHPDRHWGMAQARTTPSHRTSGLVLSHPLHTWINKNWKCCVNRNMAVRNPARNCHRAEAESAMVEKLGTLHTGGRIWPAWPRFPSLRRWVIVFRMGGIGIIVGHQCGVYRDQ